MQTIMYHGTFLTMDEKHHQPEAVLVKDGRIEAVGELNELLEMSQNARLYDLNGHTVLPGFVDGHSHITAVAYQLLIANLKPSPAGTCDSVRDMVEILKNFLGSHSLKPEQWLIGMGYDNSVFPDGKHPTKEDLDQVSMEIPIEAIHVSGHLCVVNSKGMELLGYVGDDFSVPAGGVAEANGLLKEQAFLSRHDVMKGPAPEELVSSLGNASRLYASFGITTVQDGRTGLKEYGMLSQASSQGLLCNDVVMYLKPDAAEQLLPKQFPSDNLYEGRIRLAGLKLFLDGSPQGKTAWLSAPYYKAPDGEGNDYCGFPIQTEDDVIKVMKQCVENKWQINVHANGDAAIEQMIRCYTEVLQITEHTPDLRPVIIHCQTVREDQLERMAKLSMYASFFLDHVYYWGDYHYESTLGPERAVRISPLQSALNLGVTFTLHQDSPVIPPDMLFTVHNAVNRLTKKGRLLGEDQRISMQEALKSITIYGAYQIFEESEKGSITPGKRADFVILDQNPLLTAPEQIKEIQILETIKDGISIFTKSL